MKLVLGEPVTVAMGPTLEEADWGPWQFPQLLADGDGNIYAGIDEGLDSWIEHGKDRTLWFVSRDRGGAWEKTDSDHAARGLPAAKNGDRFFAVTQLPLDVDPAVFDGIKPAHVITSGHKPIIDYYRYTDFAPGVIENRVMFRRLKNGADECDFVYPKIVGNDGLCIERPSGENKLLQPKLFGRMRVAPDGSLWQMHYDRGIIDGKFSDTFTAYYYRSTDCGETWELVSTADPTKTPGVTYYCEQDIAWTSDTHAVSVFRSNGLQVALSDDGGITWSKSRKIADFGVDPAICALKCGAILVTYGRPGFLVMPCFDGKGEKWEDPIEIIPTADQSWKMNDRSKRGNSAEWGTSSYSDIVPLSDNEALVVYDDFYIPDSEGVKRKSLMVIKITVTE